MFRADVTRFVGNLRSPAAFQAGDGLRWSDETQV
jgi:hypothetical protein